jgi:DNA-binding NarL/FixJ family response regulator
MESSARSDVSRKRSIAGTVRDRGPEIAGGSRDEGHSAARIVLVDDQYQVLSGLRELIGQTSDLVVVAACRCADGAMAAVQQYRPQVVILDVRLPDTDGFELIRDISAISEAKVIVFTASVQNAEIASILRSGAKAIVFKDQTVSELVSCVREVLDEEPLLAQQITTRERPRATVHGGVAALSAREREVAQCATAGARNKEIAWKLGICEGTVKLHLSSAYRKLKVRNRVGLLLALGKTTQVIITFVYITFVYITFDNITFDNITFDNITFDNITFV